MKDQLGTLTSIILFLASYPVWVKSIVAVWVIISAITLISLILGRPLKIENKEDGQPPLNQNVSAESMTDGNIYQAGRDNIINIESKHTEKTIQSIVLEARLTCDLKAGKEIPPAEVNFMPIGDSHSYFIGLAGKTKLDFKSPVRFRRLDPNKIVVINRFSLDSNSELLHKPLASLKNYEKLSVPIVTVVYGKSLDKISLLELVLSVNGQDVWYASYKYDVPFQVGPRFDVPLIELHKKL